jgi:excisionase family DNA binding protein
MTFPTDSKSKLLRVNNAARFLGVAPRTVRQWAEAGLLPAHKRGPKLWFFYESDLVAYLTSASPKLSGITGIIGLR